MRFGGRYLGGTLLLGNHCVPGMEPLAFTKEALRVGGRRCVCHFDAVFVFGRVPRRCRNGGLSIVVRCPGGSSAHPSPLQGLSPLFVIVLEEF